MHSEDPELAAQVRTFLEGTVPGDWESPPETDTDPGPRPTESRTGEPRQGRSEARWHEPPRTGLGSHIGPYKLVSPLGTGGMGSVYLAERDDEEFSRQVAIKLIRRGFEMPETKRRFLAERQILAAFNHPNIARMYEGGTTETGQPYLVMERIEGVRIDHFCDRRQLDMRGRLELFLQVCSAVEYAHRHLVVHRDLKPSNVLVTEDGTVKLLDFGVAKLLSQNHLLPDAELTATGLSPLTPHYASPEQIRGEAVSTSSDVYSLGALLFKILTGEVPIDLSDLSYLEWAAALDKHRTQPPSKILLAKLEKGADDDRGRGGPNPPTPPWHRQLRGDIDTIVMTALHRDLDRRYGSAEALARDIKSHLEGHPIAAHGDRLPYRSAKFIARHRLALTLLSTFLITVSSLAAYAIHQAKAATHERNLARQAQSLAEQSADVEYRLSSFLVGLFEISDPDAGVGESLTAKELLERHADRLQGHSREPPLVKARFMEAIGRAFDRLGIYDKAEAMLEDVLEIRRANLGAEHPRVIASMIALGSTKVGLGSYTEAEAMLRQALALIEGIEGDPDPLILTGVHYNLGRSLSHRGEHRESLQHFLLAAGEIEGLGARIDPIRSARIFNGLGAAHKFMDQHTEASEALGRAAEITRHHLGAFHPLLAHIEINRGQTLRRLGETAQAQEALQNALDIHLRNPSLDRQNLGTIYASLGNTYLDRGEFDQAEERYRNAAEIYEEGGATHAMSLVNVLNALAAIEFRRGQFPEAARGFEAALEALDRLPSKNRALASDLHNNLGVTLKLQEEYGRAATQLRKALELKEQTVGAKSAAAATTKANLADLERLAGRPKEAERLFLSALETFANMETAPPHATADAYQGYAELLAEEGKPDEAETYFRRALVMREDLLTPDHPELQKTLRSLATLLRAEGRASEAQRLEARLVDHSPASSSP